VSEIDELIAKSVEKYGEGLTHTLVKHPSILADVASGDIPIVKARHNLRDGEGKFRPLHDGKVTVKADGIPWRHDTRGMLPAMRRALGRGDARI
jgi:hypothetical protein